MRLQIKGFIHDGLSVAAHRLRSLMLNGVYGGKQAILNHSPVYLAPQPLF